MRIRLLTLLVVVLCSFAARATHVMGGEITWRCSGNGYVFELIFYRDCNGAEVNTITETIEVWNHPSVATIPVAFISREDISPTCTPVAGSPLQLDCGTGANAGNGIGAIEKITYRSGTIVLPGNPPAGTGWIFTYDNFSRSSLITNLVNPDTYGLTITAKMFAVPGSAGGVCIDNSPQFLQDPYLVSCAGEDYAYNMHPVDVDLDSISVAFGTPLNSFSGTYNPPANPDPVPFDTGFSATSPTPDASFQAGNIAAQLDPTSGELTFRSSTIGSFVVKVVTDSYREGVLIAQVEREMQLIVLNCNAANNAPVITPPFAGSFVTTVDAGTLVTFNLQATDAEVLQDGSPQSNTLTTSGLLYGTNFTSTGGCSVGPCATLNQTPAITGVQGVSTQFSWQTGCNHVVTAYGDVADMIPYHFVFKVQDNYCQIPKTTYRTVTINVRNPGIIPATQINCITTAPNGDVTVSWDPVADPDATFVEYQLHTVQGGQIGTYPIGTTSVTIPAPGTALDFFVNVISGCNGNATRTSDTLENVYLDLFNPNNGTAILQWNPPAPNPLPGMGTTATILREYPPGTWTTIATVPYNTVFFTDTIDICSAFLNYQVVYTTPTCQFDSNIDGDTFDDMITPDIPAISSVSVDTTSGSLVITWDVNDQPDTYGYVIYQVDPNGFLVEIDTVWGINNNSYTFNPPVNGPLTFSVAAFDSCFTISTPPTYQTSAKSPRNTSVYLTYTSNICDNTVLLDWTQYIGWGANLQDYTVFMRDPGGVWNNLGNTADTTFELQLTALEQYCFAIRANNADGTTEAFSNVLCITLTGPAPPAINYLRVATVSQNEIVLRHQVTTGTNVASVRFEKYNTRNGQFEELITIAASAPILTVTDPDVDVNSYSYRYRAIVIDSCGNFGDTTNEANTILLQVTTDQTRQINYLNWTNYTEFDGTVVLYHIFRGVDGVYSPSDLAAVTVDHRFYEDDVSQFEEYTGRFCYLIVAQEGSNQYGFAEASYSNEVCAVVDPLVYIPNAFTPDGENPVFKPILSFTDVNKFEMTILDRWGQRVFSTNDVNEGWDGVNQLNNEVVPLGTYNYVVQILDGNNQELFYRGHVTVLR